MIEPFTISPHRVRLAARVTARARRSEITGVAKGPDGRAALAVKLAAPPVDGAANIALRRLLADVLDLAVSNVAIASGETSRLKMLELSGDGERIAARLREILAR